MVPGGGEGEDAVFRDQLLHVVRAGEAEIRVGVVEREFGLALVRAVRASAAPHRRCLSAQPRGVRREFAAAALRLRLGLRAQPEPRLPQQVAAFDPQRVDPPDPDQVLDRGPLERGRGAAQKIGQRRERSAALALGHHEFGRLGPPVADHAESDPDIVSLGGAGDLARVQIGQPHPNPVPPRVAPDRVE